MSTENIDKFYALAYKDPSIVEELMTISDKEVCVNKAIEIAATHNLSFTMEEGKAWLEMMATNASKGELNDLQLEAVAGGKGGSQVAVNVVDTAANVANTAIGIVADNARSTVNDAANFFKSFF